MAALSNPCIKSPTNGAGLIGAVPMRMSQRRSHVLPGHVVHLLWDGADSWACAEAAKEAINGVKWRALLVALLVTSPRLIGWSPGTS